MLTLLVAAPLVLVVLLAAVPARVAPGWFLGPWIGLAALEVVGVAAVWAGRGGAGRIGSGLVGSGYLGEVDVRWVPALGVGYHVGVDGLSLPLVAVTAVVFLAVAVYSWGRTDRTKGWVLLFLGLEAASLGLFVALDLVLFVVFFDVSLVLMYFVIAGWGHGRARGRSALQFLLYTFLGSVVMLLGFLGLAVSVRPVSFDIPTLLAADPLAGRGVAGALVLAAVGIGLGIKTPVFPLHTWLPPAHTDAPAAGSAVLAGVLLKMGTYGFVRIAMPLLPAAWRSAAVAVMVVGLVSLLWGALVALAQRDLKRMVAFTSLTHMGYVVLAVGAAGVLRAGADARALAVTGATTQMVSHGLISAALFLLLGVLYDRGGTYDAHAWSGLAGPMPRFSIAFAVAAFAALGLPGLSGFVGEFPVIAGALGAQPVLGALAAVGIVLVAAVFLRALGRLVLGSARVPAPGAFGSPTDRGGPGDRGDDTRDDTGDAAATTAIRVPADLRPRELAAIGGLLALSALIGVAPGLLTGLVDPAARVLVELVGR